MDLFGLKRKREEKALIEAEEAKIAAEKAAEAKLEKEMETKIRIRKTLNSMKAHSKKLDVFKKEYIEKAKKAKLINSDENLRLAKQGLKIAIGRQRFLDSMIGNFEIALQMSEMNQVVNEFIGGMNVIAEELKGVTSAVDIGKAQAAYQKAIANNQNQYQALDAFIQEAEAGISSMGDQVSDISDEEIDALINNEAADSESSIDTEIDERLSAIRERMNG